jgi:4-amino-4-deoxy-L-arabinose transferase-like glycosyltransferase
MFQQIHVTTVLFVVLWLIFFGFVAFFALKLPRGVVPDETQHIDLSYAYATTWGTLNDRPDTYRFGLVSHTPFLYYWINGRLINFLQILFGNPGNWKILLTMRLFSAACASLAVLYVYLLAREVIHSRWWQLLPVFLLTSTLMFVFLASGVNYDNLANLCCFAGIYHLTRVFTAKPFVSNSLGWLIWLMIGTLTKMTVLPLLAITVLIWIFYVLRRRRQITLQPIPGWKVATLLIPMIGLALLNLSIYGVNLLQFRAVIPPCQKVLTHEQCMENAVFRRAAETIPSTPMTLANMFDGSAPDPFQWLWNFWSFEMMNMVYGITGHRIYRLPDWLANTYRLWYISILLIAVAWWKKPRFAVGALGAITIFYTLTLLQTNLKSELDSGFHHFGIQGRYIFPVIGVMYVLMPVLLAHIPTRVGKAVTALTMLLFLWSSPVKTVLTSTAVMPGPAIPAEQPGAAFGGSMEVSQDFISLCHGPLTRISVLLSAGDQPAVSPVTLQLTDLENNRMLAKQTVNAEAITNETWLDFSIPPLNGSNKHAYRMTLASPDADEQSLAVWSSKTNVYRGGDAIVQGAFTNTDLVFRYYCWQPVLIDWVY